MLGFIYAIDERFRVYIRGLTILTRMEKFLATYTRLGDGWIWLITAGVLFSVWPLDQAVVVLVRALAAGGISIAIYWLVKLGVRRKRPFEKIPGVRAEVPPLDRYSFPSGHTMNNLAAGMMVFHFYPWLGLPVVIMPLSWGLLRVYFGVHFLSDILGGVFLGWLSFRLAMLLPF